MSRLFSRDFWTLLAGGFRRGRKDVYDTTRRSIFSPEAKAGAALFALLWASGLWAAPPPAEPALWELARRWFWLRYGAWQIGALLLHVVVGVLWGVLAQSGMDFYKSLRWSSWFRSDLSRAAMAAAGAMAVHGALLVLDVGAHPAAYRGFPHALFLGTQTPGWLRAGLPAILLAVMLLAAAANMGLRLFVWFVSFGSPTRVAMGVLAVFIGLMGAGVWGVYRFQAERNAGPNLVLLIVDGLRSEDLAGKGAPALGALARGGRAFSQVVPATDEPQGALASFFFAAPPFVHGFRRPLPPESAARSAPPSLAAFLKSRGYKTAALTDAGGDFFTRFPDDWDVLRAPPDTLTARLARGVLERSIHLLPYVSGRAGRALFPPLRGASALADPDILAREAEDLIARFRFRRRFFLTVHFSRLAAGAADAADLRAIDRAAGAVAEAVGRRGLADQTWIAVWSPRGAARTEAERAAAQRLAGPVFFDAPIILCAPHLRGGARWSPAPLRAQDIAPGLLAALGLPPPERSLNAEASLPWGSPEAVIYAETAEPVGETFALPRARWVEDREAPGRLMLDPAYLDRALVGKRRMVQIGADRLIYTPGPDGVRFEYYRLDADPEAQKDLADSRVWAAHLREVKDLFYRYLSRESGWRPQNDYWLPEVFLREDPHG